MATLIETAKMCGVEPFAYLRDILIRITNGHSIKRIDELTPWHYRPAARPNTDDDLRHPENPDAKPIASSLAETGPERNVMAG